MSNSETRKYLSEAGRIIPKVKKLATRYYKTTGKPLGISGEVAEYEAIRILKLQVCEARCPGHDAIRKSITGVQKIQIKGRVLQSNSKSGQKLGSINVKKKWDCVLLVVMDENLEPLIMYEAKRSKILKALKKKGSKARNLRGQLAISMFKTLAEEVWKRK